MSKPDTLQISISKANITIEKNFYKKYIHQQVIAHLVDWGNKDFMVLPIVSAATS